MLAGVLKLGAIPSIAPYLLPAALPELQRRFPALNLQLRETVTSNLVRELVTGDLDLILHFSVRQVREAGALTPGSTMAELTGVTAAGTPWRGTDSVEVVPRRGTESGNSDLEALVAALLGGQPRRLLP